MSIDGTDMGSEQTSFPTKKAADQIGFHNEKVYSQNDMDDLRIKTIKRVLEIMESWGTQTDTDNLYRQGWEKGALFFIKQIKAEYGIKE